jgi:hypothetical protein
MSLFGRLEFSDGSYFCNICAPLFCCFKKIGPWTDFELFIDIFSATAITAPE